MKHVSSAFIGTGLEAHLRKSAVTCLVIVGAAINYCVASSLRMAADLGFEVLLPQDVVFGFGVTGPESMQHSPETVSLVTLGTLSDFAKNVSAKERSELLAPT